MNRRLVSSTVIGSAALLATLLVATPVSAHIDPDPTQAQAGSRLTVGFTVEHGCEGSPTTQLDMRLPDGVTDPVTEDIDGWEGSIEVVDGDTIVTFAGGPLADDVEGTFGVTMTLPATLDATIYFPFVQRCEVGEIRWIGIPAEPGDELDEPAPAMTLTGPVATVPPEATIPGSTTPSSTAPDVTEPVTTDSPAATTAPTEPSAVTTEVVSTSEPVVIADSSDQPGSSSTGTIAFIITMAAVFGLGAFVAYRARQSRAANPS
jgi:uncharacterized protein YcnI